MKYEVTLNNKVYEIEVEEGRALVLDEHSYVPASAPVVQPSQSPAPVVSAPAASGNGTPIDAPLPGAIMSINVKPGDSVKKGQILVVIEAMKMENELMAPRDGVISSISVSKGQSVESGTVLLYLQ